MFCVGHLSIACILLAMFVAFAASWFVNWFILRYEHLHAHMSHDHVDSGPQKHHSQPTPRIGGVSVVIGLVFAGGILSLASGYAGTSSAFGMLLLSAMPAFIGGLVEDLTKKVGVMVRLFATIISGALAAWLLGAVLNRLDIPVVDQLLHGLPFAVVLTSFAVGGIANAINIIDGYNGLAAGFAVIVLTAMAIVANQLGDYFVFGIALALAGALLGFLVWNWPGGKIFLGDGGAYLIGFVLAELAVLIVVRNPGVSPWFPVLLLIYPIFETLFSIYRRKMLGGRSPGEPDALHLHTLIYKHRIPRKTRTGQPMDNLQRNSQVAKYLWVPAIVTDALGMVFWQDTLMLVACILAFCIFYVIAYRHITLNRNFKLF